MAWKWSFPQTNESHGGFPLFAIVTVLAGRETIFKTHLRSDKAIRLASSVWKNNQPIDELWIVNMKTGNVRDTFSRDRVRGTGE